MSDVEVFSQPACMPCRRVKKQLTDAGVPFTEYDVSVDTDAADRLRGMGYAATPVVVVTLPDGVDHWHGYNPDKMRALTFLHGDDAS